MNIIDVFLNDVSSFLRTILITFIILLAVVRVGQFITLIKDIRGTNEYIGDLKLGVLSKKDLHNYTPYEFEHWCAEFLERQGFTDIVVTTSSKDRSKDIVCRKWQDMFYVECKRYPYSKESSFMVDLGAVRKLVGAMEADGVLNGMIITTGYATSEALEYVNTLPKEYKLHVVDGDELIRQYTNIKHLVYVQEKI